MTVDEFSKIYESVLSKDESINVFRDFINYYISKNRCNEQPDEQLDEFDNLYLYFATPDPYEDELRKEHKKISILNKCLADFPTVKEQAYKKLKEMEDLERRIFELIIVIPEIKSSFGEMKSASPLCHKHELTSELNMHLPIFTEFYKKETPPRHDDMDSINNVIKCLCRLTDKFSSNAFDKFGAHYYWRIKCGYRNDYEILRETLIMACKEMKIKLENLKICIDNFERKKTGEDYLRSYIPAFYNRYILTLEEKFPIFHASIPAEMKVFFKI